MMQPPQHRQSMLPLEVSPAAILDLVLSMDGTIRLLVTPAVAEVLLSMNIGNRPLIKGWVDDLTERIRRGAWKLTGEPIIVAREGILNDGQHRLHAVVESGI